MKYLLQLAFLILTSTACAQQGTEVYEKMYQNAKAYGDWPTAASSLHVLIATQEVTTNGQQPKADGSSWRDSLAYVYLNMNGYVACEKLCTEILSSEDSTDLAILEVRAVSRRNLGLVKGAVQDYKVLLQQTSNPFHAYYLTQLQMGMDSLDQGLQTIQIAEKLPYEETDWVQLPLTQSQYQSVPLRAAIYHLKGLILQNLNATENKEMALAAYDKAIELFPDFYLAKNNRQVLAGMGN